MLIVHKLFGPFYGRVVVSVNRFGNTTLDTAVRPKLVDAVTQHKTTMHAQQERCQPSNPAIQLGPNKTK